MTITKQAPTPTQPANRKHEKYDRLLQRARALAPLPTAVAYPCDESSLTAALDAARIGIIAPILVGLDILTNRADSVTARLASCAVASLVANARRENSSEKVA